MRSSILSIQFFCFDWFASDLFGGYMSTLRQILRLILEESMSSRGIGRAFNISHNTVLRYRNICQKDKLSAQKIESLNDAELLAKFKKSSGPFKSAEKFEPDWQQWANELKEKGVTQELLWQEYRLHLPEGKAYSYGHCCHMFDEYCSKLDVSMRQIHRAGEKLFIDYSGKKLKIINPVTGKITMAEVFVATMGASGYTYVEVSRSQKVEDFIQSNCNALEFFGGAPEFIVPDNLKSAVLKHTTSEVLLNPRFAEFGYHYQLFILPAEPFKPKHKAKVEGAVRYAQVKILARLRKRIFYSIDEANEAVRIELKKINDEPFQKMSGSRSSKFAALDKPALRPLPEDRYVCAEWKINYRVGKDYTVEFERNYYMVPHQLVQKYIDIKATVDTIEIFHNSVRIASYPRSRLEGEFLKNPDFMPDNHKNLNEWNRAKLTAWSQTVGESTIKVFQKLLTESSRPDLGFKTCVGIVEESKRWGMDRIESALSFALQLNSLTLSSLRSILRTGRDKVQVEISAISENDIPQSFTHIRGGDYYQKDE